MTAYPLNRLRTAVTLALIALSSAAAAPASAQMQIKTGDTGISYGTNGPSAQACRPGTAGDWLEANGSGVEGPGRRMTLIFSTAPTTDTFRAALNDAASRDLALIEIQGADGVWRKAWEGQLPPLAPGFAQNCDEHRLPQKQVIQALRYTFRQAQDAVQVDHAALLRR